MVVGCEDFIVGATVVVDVVVLLPVEVAVTVAVVLSPDEPVSVAVLTAGPENRVKEGSAGSATISHEEFPDCT